MQPSLLRLEMRAPLVTVTLCVFSGAMLASGDTRANIRPLRLLTAVVEKGKKGQAVAAEYELPEFTSERERKRFIPGEA